MTAETIRVRDAIIEKFSNKSLPELNSFIETALGTEQDENKRLGILAARVYILRMRMQNIASFNRDPSQTSLSEVTPADLMSGKASQSAVEDASGDGNVPEEAYQEWNELTVIEAGEINGVRIPKGVTITVGIEDARRLIETNKAVFAKGAPKAGEAAEAARAIQPGNDAPENNTEIESQAEDIAEASTEEASTEEAGTEEAGTEETQQTAEAQIAETGSPEGDIKADADTPAEAIEASPEAETAETEVGEETKEGDRVDEQK
ncbi:MAG: hypothetical protein QF526_03855 [Alphaproteobacteria bacterium]|nr:hypothetical protein [Alphaproteobacteria bacterium]